jgi:hypothetical protein
MDFLFDHPIVVLTAFIFSLLTVANIWSNFCDLMVKLRWEGAANAKLDKKDDDQAGTA